MKLAWKEILYNKKKYLLIELLIVLLMFMVLFLSGMANGLARAISSGIEQIDANYFLISDSSEDLITVSNLDENVLKEVKKQTDEPVATLDIQRMYLESDKSEEKLNVTYFAIPKESFLEPEVYTGKNLSESKEANPIILDDDYEVDGIEVGDRVTDSATGLEFTVVGFSTDQMYGHTSVGFITTESYTEIRKALNPSYKKSFHTIVIQSDENPNIDISGTQLDDKTTIIENLPAYQAEKLTITMIVWVLVIISAVIIGVFYYILTMQKEKQFGVMKAIGMSNSKISRVIISQVCIVAVFGALCANIITFAMSAMLPQTMPYYLPVSNACVVSMAFVLISLCSSLLSVIKVSKVDPMIVMGGNE